MPNCQFQVSIPQSVTLPERLGSVDREGFFEWLWQNFGTRGLEGVHEGTLLSEAAAQEGIESEAWVVDSAQAPSHRDWVGQLELTQAELYFSSRDAAQQAHALLSEVSGLALGPIEESTERDWNAEWEASFLNAKDGFEIAPFWRIFPVHKPKELKPGERQILINPGAGFGTGTHETTRLCLKFLGQACEAGRSLAGMRCLDFGAGSGILAIGLAILGAQVDAVEVDELAIDNARDNLKLNHMERQVQLSTELPASGAYQVIVANILRPVLMEFSETLVNRLQPDGLLVLSGLIENDVAIVVQEYARLLPTWILDLEQDGEWFALCFRSPLRQG